MILQIYSEARLGGTRQQGELYGVQYAKSGDFGIRAVQLLRKMFTGHLAVHLNRFRYYPAIMRTTTIDPLCEKYYDISPYAWCGNNTVGYVDLTGMELSVSGDSTDMVMKQIQDIAGDQMEIYLDDNGNVSYNITTDKRLKYKARELQKIIDDKNIHVFLKSIVNNYTSTGNLFVGGAFMGNVFVNDNNGRPYKVKSYQEINPLELYIMDQNDPGKNILHEITESYIGAQISLKKGIEASPAYDNIYNSLYIKAHTLASPQTTVYLDKYNSNGNITYNQYETTSAIFYIRLQSGEKIIIKSLP